jgi:hypothetical protein
LSFQINFLSYNDVYLGIIRTVKLRLFGESEPLN